MEAFSASFILLLKIKRSSSMSEKPAGGALRLEAWRIAGISLISTAYVADRISDSSRERNGFGEDGGVAWRVSEMMFSGVKGKLSKYSSAFPPASI